MTVKLDCKNIKNGELCRIPAGASITDVIKTEKLVTNHSRHKNGDRIVLETRDGKWFGTAIKYGDDGYFIVKSDR